MATRKATQDESTVEVFKDAGPPPSRGGLNKWMDQLLAISPGDAILFKDIQKGNENVLKLRIAINQYKLKYPTDPGFATRVTPEGLKVWRLTDESE